MRYLGPLIVFVLASCGCATDRGEPGEPPPKTLFSWNPGKAEEKGEAGNGEPEAPEPIATDRPDFTEASSTVGKGRIQLESGYTFVGNRAGGITTSQHSYPEALLRVGMLAEWFEFRIAQNFGNARLGTPDGISRTSGGEDLYLGVKLGLTEQKGVYPEMALIIQGRVPTGHDEFTAGKVLPGVSLLYGWDVIPDLVTFGGSTQGNSAVDSDDHTYFEVAQSLTVGYSFTEKLASYTECFAFFPSGATAAGVGPQYYLNGGFTYKVTDNFQLDIRAGVGLNRQADDFFAGSGFAVRY